MKTLHLVLAFSANWDVKLPERTRNQHRTVRGLTATVPSFLSRNLVMRCIRMRDRFRSLETVAHGCSEVLLCLAQCMVYVMASPRTWQANKPLMRMAERTDCEFDDEEA